MIKKFLVITMAALFSLTLIVGCSQNKERVSDQIKEITLCESWGFEGGFPTIFTPGKHANYQARFYLGNFYETLVDYRDGKIVPGLAESWSISDDGLIYTFTLRKGIKFSDGAALNAAAVKKSLEMIPIVLGDYKGTSEVLSVLFKNFKIIDEHVIEVHLTSPYYGALQDFAKPMVLGIMSPNAYNQDGTLSDKLLTHSMGTGPYMSAGQSAENIYTFVRNPHYWGEKPEVDQFNVKVIPDNDAKALALRNGEIDLIFGSSKITYGAFKEFSEDSRYSAKTSDENIQTRLLGFNLSKQPFNDKQVRLAISHAIDKQSIVANLFYGIETKADSFLSRTLPYCDVALEPYEYDVEKAKQLLETAGWLDSDGDGIREKDGKKLKAGLLYKSGSSVDDDLALTIAASLKKLGIEVKVSTLEILAWIAELQNGNFDIAYALTYGFPVDPYSTIANMSSEPLVDNLLVQGVAHVQDGNNIIKGLTSLVDEDEIQERYDFILQEVHQNMAFVPISYIKELVVFNADKIADYQFNGQPSNLDIAGIKPR